MTIERSGRRMKALALVVLVAAFVAGALAGIAYERLAGPEEGRWRGHHRHPLGPFAPDGPLGERLDLTEAQRRQITRLLADHRAEAEVVLGELRPRLRALREVADREVRAVLEPEQREEFDRYLAERWEAMRERWGKDREEER